jgi:hypothetical protein
MGLCFPHIPVLYHLPRIRLSPFAGILEEWLNLIVTQAMSKASELIYTHEVV